MFLKDDDLPKVWFVFHIEGVCPRPLFYHTFEAQYVVDKYELIRVNSKYTQ